VYNELEGSIQKEAAVIITWLHSNYIDGSSRQNHDYIKIIIQNNSSFKTMLFSFFKKNKIKFRRLEGKGPNHVAGLVLFQIR
jgi:hypothetical protein